MDEGTPFFGLERTEFLAKKWYVGFFRVGLDGPALCVYFESTDAGLFIMPSESAAYCDVVLGVDAQAIFDALPKIDAPGKSLSPRIAPPDCAKGYSQHPPDSAQGPAEHGNQRPRRAPVSGRGSV